MSFKTNAEKMKVSLDDCACTQCVKYHIVSYTMNQIKGKFLLFPEIKCYTKSGYADYPLVIFLSDVRKITGGGYANCSQF